VFLLWCLDGLDRAPEADEVDGAEKIIVVMPGLFYTQEQQIGCNADGVIGGCVAAP